MSKLIKLSDAVGEALAQRAAEDNLSMAGEVAKLLSVVELPPRPVGTEYLDKKFDELKSLIEDTAVDRLNSGGRNFSSTSYQDPIVKQALLRTDVDWPIIQELIYDFLNEKDSEWFPGMYEAVHEMNDVPKCFTKNSILYFDITGNPFPVLRVSPRVDQFLADRIEGSLGGRGNYQG